MMEVRGILGVVRDAADKSTCQKRITACLIFDERGGVLSCESNRCDPPDGICQRLGIKQSKEGYSEKSCNWTHAEIMAINALPKDSVPFRAILYGHDFVCTPCEVALKNAGVKTIEVVPRGSGTGLREEKHRR